MGDDLGEALGCHGHVQWLRRTWSGKHLVSFARLLHPGAGYKLRSQTRVRK